MLLNFAKIAFIFCLRIDFLNKSTRIRSSSNFHINDRTGKFKCLTIIRAIFIFKYKYFESKNASKFIFETVLIKTFYDYEKIKKYKYT